MRKTLAWLLLWTLGCGGLDLLDFGGADFAGASEAEVEAAGYTLPDGAEHVHLRDRSAIDVRSTWLRYRLPPPAFAALRDEVRARPGARRVDDARPPSHWPELAMLDDGAPPWWQPPAGAEVLRYEQRAATDGDDDGRGSLWAFDEATGTVHHWMWTLQWWGVGLPDAEAAPDADAEPDADADAEPDVDCLLDDAALTPVLDATAADVEVVRAPARDGRQLTEAVRLADGTVVTYAVGGCVHYGFTVTWTTPQLDAPVAQIRDLLARTPVPETTRAHWRSVLDQAPPEGARDGYACDEAWCEVVVDAQASTVGLSYDFAL